MADLILTINLDVAGVPTAADSVPVLRDPTNTFGVRRADSLAVVVAPGTPMLVVSGVVGRYSYTILNAVAGATYQYHVQTSIRGGAVSFAGDRTMSSTLALPSYLTLDRASSLAASLYGLKAWPTANNDDKLKALATASARVDESRRWQGRKVDANQALEFPRIDGLTATFGGRIPCPEPMGYRMAGVTLLSADPVTGDPVVPRGIETGVLWEADSILSGQRDAIAAARHDGLTDEEIGTARRSYSPATNAGGVPILCFAADRAVDNFRLRTGRRL